MRTNRRWRGLSALAAARVQRRSGFSLPMPGVRGRPSCPWEGGGALTLDAGAWATAAPSAIPFDDHWPAPQALDEADLARIRDAHANAARHADRLGFDLVELLAAHGFLMHSFLSPIANRRIDSYGGSLTNRMPYPLEVAAATREAWPRRKPLGMRITGCDWVEGGITTEEVGIFASGTTHNRFRLRLRRHQSAGAARCRDRLSGAARRRGQKGQRHCGTGGRHDRQPAPGGSNHSSCPQDAFERFRGPLFLDVNDGAGSNTRGVPAIEPSVDIGDYLVLEPV